jgi:hypothetical protein
MFNLKTLLMNNQPSNSNLPAEVHFHCVDCTRPLNGKHQNYQIEIPAVGGKLLLMVCNISCIKSDNNYAVFHFFDEHHVNRIRTVTCRTTLGLWEYLAGAGLQRVRANCIVNLTKLYYVGRNGVIEFHGQDKNEVSITDKYKNEVAEAIKTWNPILAK